MGPSHKMVASRTARRHLSPLAFAPMSWLLRYGGNSPGAGFGAGPSGSGLSQEATAAAAANAAAAAAAAVMQNTGTQPTAEGMEQVMI